MCEVSCIGLIIATGKSSDGSYFRFNIQINEIYCDKLDRICQVGFAGPWHWPASDRSDAYCDVFDVCACVCARVNGVPDLVCVMEACLIRVICVDCGI